MTWTPRRRSPCRRGTVPGGRELEKEPPRRRLRRAQDTGSMFGASKEALKRAFKVFLARWRAPEMA